MNVLGIETSCDDTSFAFFSPERGVISEFTSSQLIHEQYGGVVPEIASRAHIKTILPVFATALKKGGVARSDVEGIGVSNGPGLVGSLLVGVGFAKALALSLGIPIVGVHHMEAHIMANELEGENLECPCIVLIVSGGHTCLYLVEEIGRYRLLGATRDDAAGEAFDKIAKLLGLGYPGGPALEAIARTGKKDSVPFPRAMMDRKNFDFSLSGLKTAVRLHVEKRGAMDEAVVADIAASAQEAIVDVLAEKTVGCARANRMRHVYLAGGVAANTALRERLSSRCASTGLIYHAPAIEYCMDNGAMVAAAAAKHLLHGRNDGQDLDVFARGILTSWR
jgi:N6-L-threonylcarbamoyladenine synthase